MTNPAVEIRGLKDFRREIAKVDPKLANEMRKIHRRMSDLVLLRAQASAMAGGRQSAKAAAGLKARATNTSSRIEFVRKPPFTLGAFWGQRRRSGWYAKARYTASTGRQFPDWVGNQWDPGENGGEPYHVGPAVDGSIDELIEMYDDGIREVFRAAYPD